MKLYDSKGNAYEHTTIEQLLRQMDIPVNKVMGKNSKTMGKKVKEKTKDATI